MFCRGGLVTNRISIGIALGYSKTGEPILQYKGYVVPEFILDSIAHNWGNILQSAFQTKTCIASLQ